MQFYNLIEKKKRSKELTRSEIEFFVSGVTDGSLPDYQISAFLMAVVLNGMTDKETVYLTQAMKNSGRVMEKGEIKGVCVDKHSTGGVSDSTTLIVVPVVCSLGLKFAKLSGRGLGHTGGTLDKLESFEGYDIGISQEQFEHNVNTVGGAIAGQTADTVPADKKLYALRDVTNTIDSVPLIASSVMSKKLASFADIIVLDVKYGNGAFMTTKQGALRLSELMVHIGKQSGKKISAVVTSMNQPLGDKVGCNLEVYGAIEVLRGKKNDLYTVSKTLACEILELNGMGKAEAEKAFDESIESGKALAKLRELIVAQGGSPLFIDNEAVPPLAPYKAKLVAKKSGYIYSIKTKDVGMVNLQLGGGRVKKTDVIDHTCGIDLHKRLGDYVEEGECIATIYTSKQEVLADALENLANAYVISDKKPAKDKLVYKIIR